MSCLGEERTRANCCGQVNTAPGKNHSAYVIDRDLEVHGDVRFTGTMLDTPCTNDNVLKIGTTDAEPKAIVTADGANKYSAMVVCDGTTSFYHNETSATPLYMAGNNLQTLVCGAIAGPSGQKLTFPDESGVIATEQTVGGWWFQGTIGRCQVPLATAGTAQLPLTTVSSAGNAADKTIAQVMWSAMWKCEPSDTEVEFCFKGIPQSVGEYNGVGIGDASDLAMLVTVDKPCVLTVKNVTVNAVSM